jgi:DNA topoisomerase VI subunit A
LQNDPFIKAHPEWIAAIKQMLEMGVRAQQQALAKWGLNYVIDDYLPRQRERFPAIEAGDTLEPPTSRGNGF